MGGVGLLIPLESRDLSRDSPSTPSLQSINNSVLPSYHARHLRCAFIMEDLNVVVGLRGAENIFHRGFKYSKRRNRGSQFVTWRCSHYKKFSCGGSLRTNLHPVTYPSAAYPNS